MQIGKRFIPIEVKINALDQEAQCYAYWQYAQSRNEGKTVVYYLTKYGNMPSSWSMFSDEDSLPENSIKCISFKVDIRRWIRKCIEKADGAVKELLKQYLQIIEEFTGIGEEEVTDVVKEILLQKREFFEAGIAIERAMVDAKERLLTNVFEEFEKQMRESFFACKLLELREDSWYHYRQQVPLYYKQKGVTWPGINYCVLDFGDGRQLWFRIEVEEHLYAGFCLFDTLANDGMGEQVDIISKELKEVLKKYMNESAIALSDKKICEKFIKQAIEKIKENLFSILTIPNK